MTTKRRPMPKPSLGTSGKEAKAEIQEDHTRATKERNSQAYSFISQG